MASTDLAAELDRTVLFGGLDKDDLRRLAGIARETTLAVNETLFDQGDESDGLYIVESGIIRIYLTADDTREATINLLEDGEVIGEMALLDGLPRSAGAAALTDTRLIFIPREPFMELLELLAAAGAPDHPDAVRTPARRQRPGRPGDLS